MDTMTSVAILAFEEAGIPFSTLVRRKRLDYAVWLVQRLIAARCDVRDCFEWDAELDEKHEVRCVAYALSRLHDRMTLW